MRIKKQYIIYIPEINDHKVVTRSFLNNKEFKKFKYGRKYREVFYHKKTFKLLEFDVLFLGEL